MSPTVTVENDQKKLVKVDELSKLGTQPATTGPESVAFRSEFQKA